MDVGGGFVGMMLAPAANHAAASNRLVARPEQEGEESVPQLKRGESPVLIALRRDGREDSAAATFADDRCQYRYR